MVIGPDIRGLAEIVICFASAMIRIRNSVQVYDVYIGIPVYVFEWFGGDDFFVATARSSVLNGQDMIVMAIG